MLARDSTGKKKFLVWESEENEFETLFQVLLKWPWNWLHKGTIHLILTKSYFCFNRRTQQLEIAYLSISNFSWCRTQIILPWAYFSISFIIGCLEPSSIKRFSVFFEIAGFNTKTKKLNREVEGSIFQIFDRSVMTSSNSVLKWLLIYNNRSFNEIQEKPFPYIMKGLGSSELNPCDVITSNTVGRKTELNTPKCLKFMSAKMSVCRVFLIIGENRVQQ